MTATATRQVLNQQTSSINRTLLCIFIIGLGSDAYNNFTFCLFFINYASNARLSLIEEINQDYKEQSEISSLFATYFTTT